MKGSTQFCSADMGMAGHIKHSHRTYITRNNNRKIRSTLSQMKTSRKKNKLKTSSIVIIGRLGKAWETFGHDFLADGITTPI